MDRVREYRTIVRQIFEEVTRDTPSTEDLRTELICDDALGHYQLSEVGWDEKKRRDHVIIHADIIDGKVWIQSDETDLTLADLLLDAGIPREHIVLAFHPPHLRQYTEFATA